MVLYTIHLSKFEVEELAKVIGKGSQTLQAFLAAYFILNCDKSEFPANPDIKNSDICQILPVGDRTINRVKKKFIEEGFESILERQVSPQNYTKKWSAILKQNWRRSVVVSLPRICKMVVTTFCR